MKTVLILGAGKSATSLIHYLLNKAVANDWHIIVGDISKEVAEEKIKGFANAEAIFFDVSDAKLLELFVGKADVVASVLPARFHVVVARECLKQNKHIVTPSYISEADKALDAAFKEKGLLYMAEIGLDPGIDHMSALKTVAEIKEEGGKLEAFRSYCGALIAPESDTNPWHYKFTWAPMNVILAGQGTAQFLCDGKPKYVPYNRLFELVDAHEVKGAGTFDAYPNRDSIPYMAKYDLEDVPTFVRGTMRYSGYCQAWNALVRLGLTDNSYKLIDSDKMTLAELTESLLPNSASTDSRSLKVRSADFLGEKVDSEIMDRLEFLDLFTDRKIATKDASPALVLLEILSDKWVLSEGDKDMIVMLHKFDYEFKGKKYRRSSSMLVIGKDEDNTAIAETVGLPMAMMVKLILEGKHGDLCGVHMPIQPHIYDPILEELEEYGIQFIEETLEL